MTDVVSVCVLRECEKRYVPNIHQGCTSYITSGRKKEQESLSPIRNIERSSLMFMRMQMRIRIDRPSEHIEARGQEDEDHEAQSLA